MKQKLFKDIYALHEYMYRKAIKGKWVVAALFYQEAYNLLRYFMQDYDVDIGILDVSPDYEDCEYYVSIGDDLTFSIEPAYKNGTYLISGGDIGLVCGDADSKILSRIETDEIYEIDFDDECKCPCYECGACNIS